MKNHLFYFILFLVWSSILQSSYAAESVNHSCKASYLIDPQRIILNGAKETSCGFLDETRRQLYELIDNEGYEYILSNVVRTEEKLKLLQKKLKDNDDDFWDALDHHNSTEVGLIVGTLGLKACIPTKGLGCVMAAVGYSSAVYAYLRSGVSRGEKINKINELLKEIDAAKKEFSVHKNRLPEGYDRMVADFNQSCFLVKQYCLVK